jgi:hypothetical protein
MIKARAHKEGVRIGKTPKTSLCIKTSLTYIPEDFIQKIIVITRVETILIERMLRL